MRLCRVAVTVGLFAIIQSLFAQSIRTVAGGGTDDGRPATAVGLNQPTGVALDASGNLYIADAKHYRIRKVFASSGIITTVAGNGTTGFRGDGGPSTSAAFALPLSSALDGQGNLYIADRDNHRIRKVAAGSGIITTVAGIGSTFSGFGGDGGPATAAALFFPSGIAFDSSGNLYIADTTNNRIRKVAAASGIITTVAGIGTKGFSGDGGPATAAALFNPVSVSLDPQGNLYFSDSSNYRIRKVEAVSGIITTFAGNGKSGFSGDGGPATTAGFTSPAGIARDDAGNLYVADEFRIRRISVATGIITTVVGNGTASGGDGGAATAAGLYAFGVALDSAGNIYATDVYNHRIRKVAKGSGLISTVAGNGFSGYTRNSGDGGPATAAELVQPRGVAFDSNGNLYIADSRNARVRKVASGTKLITTVAGNGSPSGFSGDGGPATAAGIVEPYGVAVDAQQNLFVTDTSRVRRIDLGSGIVTTIAGNGTGTFSGDGGPATAAGLSAYGLAVDADSNLYIADPYNYRVRKVALATGIITTIAGNGVRGAGGDGGPATAAELYTNFDGAGLAVDAHGDLYIADTYNNRVRKVSQASGIITTVAGNGSQGVSGDDGPATAAKLYSPSALAFDAAGNLYIADSYNDRVRKVAVGTGLITTVTGNGNGSVVNNGPTGFSGDDGPATAAILAKPSGLAVSGRGDLYIADTDSNRVRVISACQPVLPPEIRVPSRGEQGVSSASRLEWSPVQGAFSYDVYLDLVNPPQRLVAPGVLVPFYNPSNLAPLTTNYWQVVAKGDPFCVPFSSSPSEVASFTTAGSCNPPGSFSDH